MTSTANNNPISLAGSVIAILHGMNASPQWGFFPEIARRITACGAIPLPLHFTGNVPTAQIDTVHHVLSAYSSNTVHFIGHSRGGAIAQIVAAERGLTAERVVIWSGIGTFARRQSRLPHEYVSDIQTNAERLDLIRSASMLRGRVRYLHAAADMIVTEKEIREFVLSANNPASLTVFPGSTHTFGITHPFTETTPTFEQAMTITLHFLGS